MTFDGAASHFPMTSFTEIMGNTLVVEAGHNVASGWLIRTMTKYAVFFSELL
jgi:hypothetical protein